MPVRRRTCGTALDGSRPMNRVIINADDYAMDEGIDTAILALARKGLVTATSAMVLSPRWREASQALREAPLSRGLHLDLTSPFADPRLSRGGLARLLFQSRARMLNKSIVRGTIDRQLDLFETGMSAAPDFVDGHQHVHHLPGVREALLDALAERFGNRASGIALRICVTKRWRGLKAAIVQATGAAGLADLAASRAHPTNSDFAGVYNFADDAALPDLWESWLSSPAPPLPLVMCHVADGASYTCSADPIRETRIREYRWLGSQAFAECLSKHSAQPVSWPRA